MRLLKQLPSPPKGKTGWPWTIESNSLTPKMSDGREWPRISIVTPSYNQARYIEETIRSVLLQNYPNLEYIIIDGESTDESVEIIKNYAPWLSYWVSEKDKGQSHAINKGFEQCSGDIFNWLCSDDILLDKALEKIATQMDLMAPGWLVGGEYYFDEQTKSTKRTEIVNTVDIATFVFWRTLAIPQPSVFWNKQLHLLAYEVNDHLHYCMDLDLWFRFYKAANPVIFRDYLARRRVHRSAKTTFYGERYEDFMQELSCWILEKLYQSPDEAVVQEVRNSIISVQEKSIALDRIKKHFIFGRALRFWKRFVNNSLPI